MFSWVPIHKEAIHKILAHQNEQEALIAVLREMKQSGLKVISLEDKDANDKTVPLSEVDPFTFLATFNRGITEENRRENWNFLKTRWKLQSPVPEDFKGIPVMFNMNSWFFPWAKDKSKSHIQELWAIAGQAVKGGADQVDGDLFNRCAGLPLVNPNRLTIGLFWLNPEKFLPADNKTMEHSKAKGVKTDPTDYQSYLQWLKEMTERFGDNYPEISHAAHFFAIQGKNWGFTKWMGPV